VDRRAREREIVREVPVQTKNTNFNPGLIPEERMGEKIDRQMVEKRHIGSSFMS